MLPLYQLHLQIQTHTHTKTQELCMCTHTHTHFLSVFVCVSILLDHCDALTCPVQCLSDSGGSPPHTPVCVRTRVTPRHWCLSTAQSLYWSGLGTLNLSKLSCISSVKPSSGSWTQMAVPCGFCRLI